MNFFKNLSLELNVHGYLLSCNANCNANRNANCNANCNEPNEDPGALLDIRYLLSYLRTLEGGLLGLLQT